MDENLVSHFHIRWIVEGSSRTDWEAFASRDEADAMAKLLKTPSEVYAIDEFYASCERCAMFRLERKIPN